MDELKKQMQGLQYSMSGIVKGMAILSNATVNDLETKRRIKEALVKGEEAEPLIGLITTKISKDIDNAKITEGIDKIISLLEKVPKDKDISEEEKAEIEILLRKTKENDTK